jgi:ABC-type Zn uptake system ZnuABC Zn-binding protein ZnuA
MMHMRVVSRAFHRAYRRRWAVGVILLATLLGAGCRSPDRPADGGARLVVVVTHSILGDLVHQVGGAAIELQVLVGPGADSHSFEPGAADSVLLARADVIVENGLGFEGWLDGLVAASGSRAARIVAAEGVAPLVAGAAGGSAGELDPHVWWDVENAMSMVGAVRDGLVAADPANAAGYRDRAERYLQELRQLDAEIVRQVATIPPAQRKLVTSHDTFAYFARRYGFEVVGTALGAATTEAAEPSAAAMARLVQEIRAAGVPALFAENVGNPDLIERIADEAGVALGPTLYTDALGPPGSAGDTYVKMMRANVAALSAALGGAGR